MKDIVKLRLTQIKLSEGTRIRKNFPALAESVRTIGIMFPIVVMYLGQDQYEILDGDQRYNALRLLGFPEIECLIWDRTMQEGFAFRKLTR